MSSRLLLLGSFVLAVFLLAVMNWTTPQDIGSVGVFVFFIMFYVMCVGVGIAACRLFFAAKMRERTTSKNVRRKSNFYGVILALAPMMLLMFQSFGGLRLFEVVLVGVVTGLLCFLTAKQIL